MDIRFENTDTNFTNGLIRHVIKNYTGIIPRVGEEVRLLDVDDGGPVREVQCVGHFIRENSHEVCVYLFVTEL